MTEKMDKARTRELLNKIAELGGKGMKDEDIVFSGQKLVLPERWKGSLKSAIDYLIKKREEEEEPSNFTRTYNYRPWDGAYNAILAMKEAFGMVSGVTTYSFFGANPPKYIQVPVGLGVTEEIPWGNFQIPLLEQTMITFGQSLHKEYGQVFQINISSPRKNRDVINGLFILIEEKLKTNSIYRGKAIDGQTQPEFLDLSGFSADKVVYSDQVQADLEAHLWSVIKYPEQQKNLGLALKRAILLHGPYGTGKSLAGMRTAVEAVKAGWTFLMARPGRDDFREVMQTARLYQPAVVFMEDIDTLAAPESQDKISQLLDLFDGIQAKGTEILIALTTNHPDTLHKGFMRPGRLDALIEIAHLDAVGIEKLIKVLIGDRLSPIIWWNEVTDAARGYHPAFIKEMANRAVRYALVRNDGDIADITINTDDLKFAAQGLRDQFQRMEDAPEHSTGDTLSESLQKITGQAIANVAVDAKNADDPTYAVWDVTKLGEFQNGQ